MLILTLINENTKEKTFDWINLLKKQGHSKRSHIAKDAMKD